MALKSSAKKKKSTEKRRDSLISRIMQGRWLSTDFFARNSIIILFVIFFLMIYISNKYECLTKMERIQALERDLEVIKTESVRERSEYMSRTRESAMQQLVDTLHLDLRVQERPPFSITYSR